MNDMQLANAVHDLGASVAQEGSLTPDEFYYKLVRDWRVAGALMEKVVEGPGCIVFGKYSEDLTSTRVTFHGGDREWRADNSSTPRSIIEACVQALEPK